MAVGAGAGGVAYYSGELKATESASLDKTWAATQAAIADLQFGVTSVSKDALEATLHASTATGRTLKVRLHRVADAATELRIRVGTFGDEEISRQVLDRIHSRL